MHITLQATLITSVHFPQLRTNTNKTPQHPYTFKFTCIAYNRSHTSSLLLCKHLMDYHLASKDQGLLFREEHVCDTSLAVPNMNLNKQCTCKSYLMLLLGRKVPQ